MLKRKDILQYAVLCCECLPITGIFLLLLLDATEYVQVT